MKQAVIIFFFTLAVTLLYNHVGQLVPQKEVYPPKSAEIRADMSSEEMVEAGKILVEGKGTCLTCHNGSERFPVLEGIGARAGAQKEGMNAVDYLAESLYDPNVFIVKPFAPGMPAAHKPPIGLNDQEILTIIAYLESLGGEPTVTMDTKFKWQGSAGSTETAAAAPDAGGEAAKELTPEEMTTKYGCLGCHSFTAPVRMLGPSLYDVGSRLSTAELWESLLDPDAVIAESYPPATMTAMLKGNGFYTDLSQAQMKALVDYLASLKGSS